MTSNILFSIALISSHLLSPIHSAICPEIFDQTAPHALGIQFADESITTRDQAPIVAKAKAAIAPQLHWNTEPGSYYTVLMADPDAPSRSNPMMAQWLHWLVVNVADTAMSNIEEGDTLVSYAGPTPPKGTADHRYCLYVFEQEEGYNEQLANLEYPRPKFNAQDFVTDASKEGATLQLVAANYFYANHDKTDL